MTVFRIIHRDLITSGKPVYALCEVTLDANGDVASWSPEGIKLRAESAAGLLSAVFDLRAAFDKEILRESELNARSVRMRA
jgi:hypothetical protein